MGVTRVDRLVDGRVDEGGARLGDRAGWVLLAREREYASMV